MTSEKLGTVLIDQGVLTPGELSLGLAVQEVQEGRQKLGDVLLRHDLVDAGQLQQALACQSGWPVFEGELIADMDAVKELGGSFLAGHGIFPVKGGDRPSFVVSDPYDTQATDHILAAYGSDAAFYIGKRDEVLCAVGVFIDKAPEATGAAASVNVRDEADALLDEAIALNATDIHIEPSDGAVVVRVRVDGLLRFHRAFPSKENARLVNIFFNRAGISAGDFLRFHDARFEYTAGHKRMDVRLSHIPANHGSSLVLRLLDKDRAAVSLQELGYAPQHEAAIARALIKPHGITLVTGPTGCGKTTSLYAMLGSLKEVGIKVVAVEDPVEIGLSLVTQVPVDVKKGHDFHQVARAFLRHDPDIILIGEVRDEKTATEAVRAAITGHRVFSTLHTNDAVSALLRLHDLGVGYNYIAGTLVCVVSQRLVRKLCLRCRKERFVTPSSVAECQRPFVDAPGMIVFEADRRGCGECCEGVSGRTVIAEVLLIDDEMRFLIEQGLVHEVALRLREKNDFLTMRADAARLVREGVIGLDEAVRVAG